VNPDREAASAPVTVYLDGVATPARPGETVAALLVRERQPVTLFCGMGACHTCAVTIDGILGRRACVERVWDGMTIELRSRET
jgi:ferredoxin